MTNDFRSHWKQTTACFAIVLLGLLWFGSSRMMRDPGTLWHTVAGETMLREGRIMRSDEFSFTHANDEWLAQQWLGECGMALVHRVAGLDGLLLGACVIIATIFATLAHRCVRAGMPPPATVLLLLVTAAASSYHFMPRPHLVTILLSALGTMLLCDVEAGRLSPRQMFWIPLCMMVWANVHGGALGGLASVTLVGFGWLLRPKWLPRCAGDIGTAMPHMIGAVIALSLIAILVNPFGVSLPRVWISLLNSDVLPRVIIEHAPTDLLSGEGLMLMLLGAVYFFLLARIFQSGVRVLWLLPIPWLVLALSRVRHGPIFAVITAVVIIDMARQLLAIRGQTVVGDVRPAPAPRTFKHRWPTRYASLGLPVLMVIILGAIKSAGIAVPVVGSGWARLDPAYWPTKATAALNLRLSENDAETRVFNDMRYGGYLIYAAPSAGIYVDDRCELYRDAGLLRYVELQRHPERIEGEAALHDIHFAMVQTKSPMERYLSQAAGWRVVHQDATACLFERNLTLIRR